MTAATLTLADFVLQRIADDEAAAHAADSALTDWDSWPAVASDAIPLRKWEVGNHIARHDPARVIAECEAKRRIVEMWSAATRAADSVDGVDDDAWAILRATSETARVAAALLALPYADHPDYDEAWRP